MNLKFLHKDNFHFSLFLKNTISTIYSHIDTAWNKSNIYKNSEKTNHETLDVYSHSLFPSYLEPTIKNNFVCRKIFQKPGFAIHLNDCDNVNDYIKTNCSTSLKKTLKRSIKRLEGCLDISYKMYFGDISSENYQYLMETLHTMLIKRFQQRNDNNDVLNDWGFYLNNSFNLINNKKASLFVIFNNKEPIEISLNYHFDSIIYSHISSYNLDYSKYGLGNVEIYKQLEWCINNNFKVFDMGYGDFDYKRRWSNLIYDFNHNIVYHPKNVLGPLLGIIFKSKYKLINYLISKKVNVYYNNVKHFIKGNPNKINYMPLEFKSQTIAHIIDSSPNGYEQLNIDDNNFFFLRKPLFDFLYTFQEHISMVTIYKTLEDKKSFLFIGKNNTNKITVN
ncbi:GNAT family N-acetyltransferase [Flavivirga sp. 57AJ16]|uniref:GNAT family N-acetyltransferase n=1 Tax=Flavivirga sp. 57AJ16 TaxID=3025307 RepID=UPI0023661BD7|nr:GNAT family N-acetyltransferase [Flavivirga sp. 57AJ16]MDD7885842.1 GNAT family N-acetyltransferase [Flavivirga sp. 57AJ16]